MPKERVLVVDDEEDILAVVKYHLEREGFRVILATTGEEAMDLVKNKMPDLILLDLMLPGIDGLEVTKKLKLDDKTKNIPIIMLTAKDEEADIVTGLEMGADDYVTKPFSPRVLVARIKAILRRKKQDINETTVIKFDGLFIHLGKREVLIDKKIVNLTGTEFKILVLLASKPGWVFTRSQIVEAVHGDEYVVTDRAVDVQITGLRKKLGEYGKYIETVRGIGYKFKEIR